MSKVRRFQKRVALLAVIVIPGALLIASVVLLVLEMLLLWRFFWANPLGHFVVVVRIVIIFGGPSALVAVIFLALRIYFKRVSEEEVLLIAVLGGQGGMAINYLWTAKPVVKKVLCDTCVLSSREPSFWADIASPVLAVMTMIALTGAFSVIIAGLLLPVLEYFGFVEKE